MGWQHRHGGACPCYDVKGRHLAGCSFQCCRALTAGANSGRRQEQTWSREGELEGPPLSLYIVYIQRERGPASSIALHRPPSTRCHRPSSSSFSSRSSLQPCLPAAVPTMDSRRALRLPRACIGQPPCKTGPYTAAGHGFIAPAVPVLDVLRAACCVLVCCLQPNRSLPALPGFTSPLYYVDVAASALPRNRP